MVASTSQARQQAIQQPHGVEAKHTSAQQRKQLSDYVREDTNLTANSTGRHLRVATVAKRRLLPILGWVAAITAVVALFALATLQALIVEGQTRLDGINAELEQVRAANDRLRLNVARAEAPERVVAVAINVLGMVEPERRVYLTPVERD